MFSTTWIRSLKLPGSSLRALPGELELPPQPYRAQLLTGDLLVQFAKQLATSHQVAAPRGRSKLLLERLDQNHDTLRQAYFTLAEVAGKHELLPQGSDWLLDNFYGIEEQIEDIRRYFPKSYSRVLPRIQDGQYRGIPRVYPLALEFISHTDAMLVEEQLDHFVRAYQEINYLSIGELWAVPIMLRLGLVENLARLALNLLTDLAHRVESESIARQLLNDESLPGTILLSHIVAHFDENPRSLSMVGAYLTKRLGEVGPRAALALKWLEERMREEGTSSDEIVRREQQFQSSNLTSIGNTVASLKRIGSINWRNWFERNCLLESMLRADPASIYGASDFLTRDRYRGRVETLARYTALDERAVTQALLEYAREAEKSNAHYKRRHIGYYLIDKGSREFERTLRYSSPPLERLRRGLKRRPLLLYLGALLLITLAIMFEAAEYSRIWGASEWLALLIAMVLALPASDLGNNVLQWLIANFIVSPERLPRLDFAEGLPEHSRSVVVVHCIFQHPAVIPRVIEGLEVRFLANDDPNLCFGLLADLPDAPELTMPGDAAIIDALRSGVTRLNERYCAQGPERFFVFIRERKYNTSQKCFMGWERKRGKVVEFNQFLRGTESTSLRLLVGNKDFLRSAHYVITLDVDAQLPRGVARDLIGILKHPLNHPVIDPKTRAVREGYAIIQPRIGLSAQSAHASLFSRIFSGYSGLDPYTQAVSDVYQDLFDEASFVGKGAYNIEAFEHVVHQRIPENSLLSHDLFEGFYARTGLASDLEVLDEFPRNYHGYSRRQHRWVRGDWQLLPWLGRTVPILDAAREPTPLNGFDRWRLLDNLRRSLIAPNLMLLFFLGWTVFPGAPELWTLLALLVVAFPVYARVANALILPPLGFSVSGYVQNVGRDLLKLSAQAAISLCFLPHQALLMCNAIGVTLYRLFVTHEKMLEWETAFHTEHRFRGDLPSVWKDMAASVLLGVGMSLLALVIAPGSWLIILPLCLGWGVAPLLAWHLGKPLPSKTETLDRDETSMLQYVAYATWRYFERNLCLEHNYLIPDNLQLYSQGPVLANRTSPTNLGMSLLAIIGAYNLGFISLPSALEMLQRSLQEMEKLERVRGHFLNWYQTDNRRSLSPRYISTVDSGNLVGHLMVVAQFLEGALNLPLLSNNARVLEGLTAPSPICSEWIPPAQAVEGARQHLREMFSDSQVADSATHASLSDELHQRGSDSTTIRGLQSLAARRTAALKLCKKFIHETEFALLYDRDRNLFAIGYNLDSGKLDNSYYDLLASESRLTSLVAIALGQIPQKHWFALGRSLTDSPGGKTLLSWAGTMFEYLMPCLVMKDIPGALLSSSYTSVIKTQEIYAKKRGVPWGISESGYSVVDSHGTYQYRAFGVPGLGLKRGLSEDLVIAPYASLMAVPHSPKSCVRNLKLLAQQGACGEFGYFEALDFTSERLGPGERCHVVKSYFAHHQGMAFAALTNFLSPDYFQGLFHQDLRIRASELLLAERFPERIPALVPHRAELIVDNRRPGASEQLFEVILTPHTGVPLTHVLSNGTLTVVADNAGSGYTSFEKDILVNRWREDPVLNNYGSYVYIRDLERNALWSTAYQPTRVAADDYEVIFAPDKIEYRRRDGDIRTHTEITVAPTDNVEIRRITLTNVGHRIRRLELTSFAEVALASERADRAHPAFSKMFVQSEFLPDYDALLFSRRKRSRKDAPLYCFHKLTLRVIWQRTQWESSRESFLGRGRDMHEPHALQSNQPLSGTTGSVLDPVFALRTAVEIEPGQSQTVVFVTGASRNRDELLQTIGRYHDQTTIRRAFEQAQSQSSVEIRQQQYSPEQLSGFRRLANALFFNIREVRGPSEFIEGNRLQQSGLWRFGISGDLPIVLMRVSDSRHVRMVRQLIAAHQFHRMRGISFDVVLLNDEDASYAQALHDEIEHLIRGSGAGGVLDQRGGIFVRKSFQMTEEEVRLLHAVARVVVGPEHGSLRAALSETGAFDEAEVLTPESRPRKVNHSTPRLAQKRVEGELPSPLGAFGDWGKSYSILVGPSSKTPSPWCNVVANPHFGFLVSESGATYTWSENSRENRLTPWSNDPVSDPCGEALFLVDDDSSEVWTATPNPGAHHCLFEVTHEFGGSRFLTTNSGIEQELLMHGSSSERVKWWRLRLKNNSTHTRSLRLYFYVHPVLGVQPNESYRFLSSSYDRGAQLLTMQNFYNNEFAGRVLSVGTSEPVRSYTTDRLEFIGSSGELGTARAVRELRPLSGRVGAGYSQCLALETSCKLVAGETKELVFFIAESMSPDEARSKASSFHSVLHARAEHENVRRYWENLTTSLQVRTPDRSFDIMVNGWLLYQTISCRLWGRSGFYQSGGAIGFRDQLQDSLALLPLRPEMARQQIMLHASRQFVEGDVQHWWHPPTGRGVRTRISDDLLWLPFAVAEYIDATGDRTILDERVSFLEGANLEANQEDLYSQPRQGPAEGSIYEHCLRAIERASSLGRHGLPLMGSGDWNDGMNEVGLHGKGESVWLGWFLYTVLQKFSPISSTRGDAERAELYRQRASALQESLENHTWDGNWYTRAYFDDGTPLGSVQSPECRIDSLSQSWACMSGAGATQRCATALTSCLEQLVDREASIIKLLTPAFDNSALEPGYIKGYLPGIRENGGQYTHAAAWFIIACASMGWGSKAFELFQLINPARITSSIEGIERYKGEPFVYCGDVYSNPEHRGRAGWSWYTGSAGWLYRAATEHILGLRVQANRFRVNPTIPPHWDQFSLTYRTQGQVFEIQVENPHHCEHGIKEVYLENALVVDGWIPIPTDKKNQTLRVRVVLG